MRFCFFVKCCSLLFSIAFMSLPWIVNIAQISCLSFQCMVPSFLSHKKFVWPFSNHCVMNPSVYLPRSAVIVSRAYVFWLSKSFRNFLTSAKCQSKCDGFFDQYCVTKTKQLNLALNLLQQHSELCQCIAWNGRQCRLSHSQWGHNLMQDYVLLWTCFVSWKYKKHKPFIICMIGLSLLWTLLPSLVHQWLFYSMDNMRFWRNYSLPVILSFI